VFIASAIEAVMNGFNGGDQEQSNSAQRAPLPPQVAGRNCDRP